MLLSLRCSRVKENVIRSRSCKSTLNVSYAKSPYIYYIKGKSTSDVRARTSSELPEASSILMTYSREACTELELVTKVMSVTTVARFLDLMLHFHLLFTA